MLVQALKSNWKKKLICFFIIIQITISITTLIDAVIIFEQTLEYKSNVDHFIGIKDKYVINTKKQLEINEGEKYSNNIDTILNSIEKNNKINYFMSSNILLGIDKLLNVDEKKSSKLKDMLSKNIDKSGEIYVNSFVIDKGFIDIMNVKVTDGRNLSKKDFLKKDKEVIPILAGNDFIGKLELGSQFTTIDGTYEVVGFLEDNQVFLSGASDKVSSEMRNLKQCFIVPITEKSSNDPYMSFQRLNGNMFFEVKPEFKNIEDKIVDEVVSIYNENGFYSKSINLGSQLEGIINENNNLVKQYLVKGVVLTVFSILTLNITMVIFIKMREREFGIRIACGASIKDIIQQIFIEISLLIILGLIIYISITFFDYYKFMTWDQNYLYKDKMSIISSYSIPFMAVLKSSIIIIFISLFSSIIPVLKVKNTSIKDLIRGL